VDSTDHFQLAGSDFRGFVACVAASKTIPRDPRFAKRYRFWKLPVYLLLITCFFGGVGSLSHLAFGISLSQVIVSFALSIRFPSFALHRSQLIEHGNIIVEGALKERNLFTRNLTPAGFIEKIILFFTHNDSLEHVLHHTLPQY